MRVLVIEDAVRYGAGTIALDAARADGVPAAVLTVHDEGAGMAQAKPAGDRTPARA
jgi:signal transduction histidine kinase